ncbi:hypothetical protein KY084_04245 [Stakelama sp. CBK3Z-3]|uniref:Glycosyltransferase family 1 protein n=1 Tax=Stakelama flava TaxID=2860338 RepID=A0ABS6XIP4_9SPHN|nr:hypothetical protein [Stakelama flava]MBW4330083.1 hypothetical protein [Stakelama flava]
MSRLSGGIALQPSELGQSVRILFYLPVITPWWFDAIVAPMVERLAEGHEVHILAPVPWSGTGVGPDQIGRCAHLSQLHWHIVDGPDHPTMRCEPADRAGIIEFVHTLAPDYVLCRSADCETVQAFPGTVRHIMEGGAAPLSIPPEWVIFQQAPFDHGLLPDLTEAEAARLDVLFAPEWERLSAERRTSRHMRKAFREWAELPKDRAVLTIPLEYEHEENFFAMHRIGARPNAALVAELAERIDDRFFLAFTNHPLNEKHVDNSAVIAAIAAHPERMRLLPGIDPEDASTTMTLARDADGMMIGDTKAFALGAFYGTPMLRRTHFRTGEWLNAYNDMDDFLRAVEEGRAAVPDDDYARRWFAYHVANNVFDPNDPDLMGADILARIDMPHDPARWENGIARYRAAMEVDA